MQGDATYLITKEDGTLEPFGVNAVCTHLGCVVPWNKSANKFCCPCHGSQYDKNGKVTVLLATVARTVDLGEEFRFIMHMMCVRFTQIWRVGLLGWVWL